MIDLEPRVDTERRIIILAQGQQTRLPQLSFPKQLLLLPHCANTPILHRTVAQLAVLAPGAQVTIVGDAAIERTMPALRELLTQLSVRRLPVTRQRFEVLRTYMLEEPGNSSLKGIERYLVQQEPGGAFEVPVPEDRSYVVLLGDTVYSWRCLRAILTQGNAWQVSFVGTSNLSNSAGELWGLSWSGPTDWATRSALRRAVLKHPPFTTYQCGQLRRWLWAVDEIVHQGREAGVFFEDDDGGRPWFTAIDDYTKDIDVPVDLDLIHPLAVMAAADDFAEGLRW